MANTLNICMRKLMRWGKKERTLPQEIRPKINKVIYQKDRQIAKHILYFLSLPVNEEIQVKDETIFHLLNWQVFFNNIQYMTRHGKKTHGLRV